MITLHPEPWFGQAAPLPPGSAEKLATKLRIPVAHLRAVMRVESSRGYFEADGSVPRRFEPHVFEGRPADWRKSMALSKSARERAFQEAYKASPERALKACSWGAFQIMGYHYAKLGYSSAKDMVQAHAHSAACQLSDFGKFLQINKLVLPLRSGDWPAFARGYNGSGNVASYSAKLRRAVKRETGISPVPVLMLGDRGEDVRRLQIALGVAPDGNFGPETLNAVREFQEKESLTIDGVVGVQTWGRLQLVRQIRAPRATALDDLADSIPRGLVSGLGGAGAAGGTLASFAPTWAIHAAFALFFLAAITLGLIWLRERYGR